MAWWFTYGLKSLIGTDFLLGGDSAGATKRFAGTEIGKLNVEGQTLAGGAGVTVKVLSVPVSPDAPLIIDPSARPLQYISNVASFTLQAPTVDGSCMLMIANPSSPDIPAGTVTFSGFSNGSSTGDAMTTTPGHVFTVQIWRINGISGYRIAAHQ